MGIHRRTARARAELAMPSKNYLDLVLLVFFFAAPFTLSLPTIRQVVPESPNDPQSVDALGFSEDFDKRDLADVASSSLLISVQHSTDFSLEAIQEDAQTMVRIRSSVSHLSQHQLSMGTDALKEDKSLAADQLGAISALQMMLKKWSVTLRPGYLPRQHSVVVSIRTLIRQITQKVHEMSTPPQPTAVNGISWNASQQVCAADGKQLCTFDEICPNGEGSTPIDGSSDQAEAWSPMTRADGVVNDWVHISDSDKGSNCKPHDKYNGLPAWGTEATNAYNFKIYCCYDISGQLATIEEMRDQLHKLYDITEAPTAEPTTSPIAPLPVMQPVSSEPTSEPTVFVPDGEWRPGYHCSQSDPSSVIKSLVLDLYPDEAQAYCKAACDDLDNCVYANLHLGTPTGSTALWPQSGPSNRKCENTGNEVHCKTESAKCIVADQAACQAKAVAAGAGWYSFRADAQKCFYSTTCSSPKTETFWPWQVFSTPFSSCVLHTRECILDTRDDKSVYIKSCNLDYMTGALECTDHRFN